MEDIFYSKHKHKGIYKMGCNIQLKVRLEISSFENLTIFIRNLPFAVFALLNHDLLLPTLIFNYKHFHIVISCRTSLPPLFAIDSDTTRFHKKKTKHLHTNIKHVTTTDHKQPTFGIFFSFFFFFFSFSLFTLCFKKKKEREKKKHRTTVKSNNQPTIC